MAEEKSKSEISVIFVDDLSYEATHIFNANGFPDEVAELVSACVTRLVILRHSAREVRREVSNDLKVFQKKVNDRHRDLTTFAKKRPDLKYVFYHENTSYMAAMCSTLIYLKSFLDVYSKLIVRSFDPNQDVLFSGIYTNEKGSRIKGGKLIRWLQRSAPEESKCLYKLIIQHSEDWITSAVNYRDTLAHFGDLPDLLRMSVSLQPNFTKIEVWEIELPKMPHRQDVREYVSDLCENLRKFLQDTIPYIPGVKLELLDFRAFPLDK